MTTKYGLSVTNYVFHPDIERKRSEEQSDAYKKYLANIGKLGGLITSLYQSNPLLSTSLLAELKNISETSDLVINGELDKVTSKLIYDGLNARILSLLLAHSPLPAKVK